MTFDTNKNCHLHETGHSLLQENQLLNMIHLLIKMQQTNNIIKKSNRTLLTQPHPSTPVSGEMYYFLILKDSLTNSRNT